METALAQRVHAVAIRLLRYARVVDVEQGLSAPRLSVLSVLVFGGPRTVTELARAEQVAAATMSRMLTSLEGEGYVRRRRDERDTRVVHVKATARGRRALMRGRDARVHRLEGVLERLSATERRVVDQAFDLLAEAVAASIEAESS